MGATTRQATGAAPARGSGLRELLAERPAPLLTRGTFRPVPWIISGLLHASIVFGAFFVAWSVTPGVRDDAQAPVVSFEAPAFAPPPLVEKPLEEDADATPAEALPPLPDLAGAGPGMELPVTARGTVALPELDAPPPPAAPRPSESRVDFAGLGASDARRIVYVIDASGSMITSYPDLVAQFKRSVERLHPTQRFQALLLRGRPGEAGIEAAPFPERVRRPVLLDATRGHKRAVIDWVTAQRPSGGSNALAALEAALELGPDAVFVIGRFGAADLFDATLPEILNRLDQLNPINPATGERRVTIKTIQIMSPDPTGVMRAIGEAHGGEDGYKFMTVDELSAPPMEEL